MKNTETSALGLALLVALVSAPAVAAEKSQDSKDTPVTFQAFAVNLDAANGAAAGPIDITIERWSTAEERATLHTALTSKGTDALLRALQDTKKRAGFIRGSRGGLGWDIQYARKAPLPDGGYRVVIGTDRPMSFFERANHPRSADYEFLVAELRIGKDGQGEGKLFPAARVTFDEGENAIEIENYANQPVQLTKVTEVKSDKKEHEEKDKAAKKEK